MIVVTEDRSVERGILHIGGYDRVCLRIDQQATQKHARALRQIVLEFGEAAILVR